MGYVVPVCGSRWFQPWDSMIPVGGFCFFGVGLLRLWIFFFFFFFQCGLLPGMHGRGPKAGAPASDTAGRGDAVGTPQTARPCRVGPRRATWQGPNRADASRRG